MSVLEAQRYYKNPQSIYQFQFINFIEIYFIHQNF